MELLGYPRDRPPRRRTAEALSVRGDRFSVGVLNPGPRSPVNCAIKAPYVAADAILPHCVHISLVPVTACAEALCGAIMGSVASFDAAEADAASKGNLRACRACASRLVEAYV